MISKINKPNTVLKSGEVDQDNEMPDIRLLYTGNQIQKAGQTLINPDIAEEEYLNAMDILSNWRATHAFPLNSIQNLLRSNSKKIDKNCTISQRLKRVPSIQNKLKRFPNMKLNGMQDIGGCRAVLETAENVLELQELLVNSKTDHQITSKKDYITQPKESGYRGIHLIYKYCGDKKEIYHRHKIEIQIRSKIQHSWATAVEIVDTFTKNSLKTGEGNKDWLDFFSETSILFSALEEYFIEGYDTEKKIKEYLNTTANKIENLNKNLNVISNFIGFSVSSKILQNDQNSKYFLLILDTENRKINARGYKERDFEEASEEYIKCEKEFKNNKKYNIALVSGDSIKALRIAYPNYFSNSQMFIKNLEKAFYGLDRRLEEF